MSAYLCSNDTFDLLASFASTHRDGINSAYLERCHDYAAKKGAGLLFDGLMTADVVAAILRQENIRSLSARYSGEYADSEGARPYKHRYASIDILNIEAIILQSCRCLRYQSCESDDYETTVAHRLLEMIEAKAIRRLADRCEAPWGWTRQWQAEQDAKVREARVKLDAAFAASQTPVTAR